MARPSPFLEPGSRTRPGSLALVHLSRDNLLPVILQESEGNHDGYAEGVVLNTRYGSFPHSTLIDVPWGSQIRASAVDTGSRGRKRKRTAGDEESKASTPAEDTKDEDAAKRMPAKKAVTASSGFVHVLPPTPELWTLSLPHRTQVVYTPDYSYILQRIRARPGTRLIEAGAGSGSFTHASVRAVYNGYPEPAGGEKGKVFSFEFHKPRFEKLTEELRVHGLDGLVQLTHRDVCHGGFLVDGQSPNATAVFLDLPAPWDALPQLSRRRLASTAKGQQDSQQTDDGTNSWISPLDPTRSVYLCTFSPCIEQVTRTVSTMRSLGWVEIEMVEIAHKKLYVSRDKVTEKAGQTPADVAEAVARLKELEKHAREYHGLVAVSNTRETEEADNKIEADEKNGEKDGDQQSGLEKPDGVVKPWLQGQLSHRPETELKTHTSYLVFAILPREWSEEDEATALAQWPCGGERKIIGNLPKDVRKEEKRELLKGKKRAKGNDGAPVAPPSASVPMEVETS